MTERSLANIHPHSVTGPLPHLQPSFSGHEPSPAATGTSATACVRPAAAVSTQATFQAICEAHLDQVWRQLRAMGVHPSYLDDATQEVFLIAFQKIDAFDGQAKVSTWLYAIAYRVGCNYRRKLRRESTDELMETEHASTQLDPEQSLEERRAADLVQQFCAGLSEKLRDVFVLCLLEGQPAKDVAEFLGTSENTIYSRIRLVREAFRKELQRQEQALL